MKKYVVSLDQGTTSSRAILFNYSGEIVAVSQKEFTQYFPQPGWVEHDPEEIYQSQLAVLVDLIKKSGIQAAEIASIGITNQRETTILWDKKTHKAIHNAIVWQDRRTASYCEELKEEGLGKSIQGKTGLVIDAYFSGTKLKWLLDHVEGARMNASKGKLAFGTVDSWLIWRLSGGKVHATDVSNASRTMLYNIHTLEWDKDLLVLFDIPEDVLPQVCSSSEIIAYLDEQILGEKIPISGVAGDQQAALFGQLCIEPGMAKNTYGTGCFLVMNTGTQVVTSQNKLLSTIAWKIGEETTYALEGSVFVGGAAIQWLRDGLKIIDSAEVSELRATSVTDNGGVVFVPALTGLGAPYWDPYARGSIFGISRGTTQEHIIRATLESIAFQVSDVIDAMTKDTGEQLKELRVDGGAVKNSLLLQFQADILGVSVVRPTILETTALGVAYLSGLAVGFWSGIEEIKSQWSNEKTFESQMSPFEKEKALDLWKKAVSRTRNWAL